MPCRRVPCARNDHASMPRARAAAPEAGDRRLTALAGAVAVALAIAFSAAAAKAGEPERPPQLASAEIDDRTLATVSYGCGWAEKRLADPAWRPFLSRVTRACQAIADNPDPRQITQQSYRERAFTAALDRAARGLDKLYLEMWRVQLASPAQTLGMVALNDTGVFLALQHERVFRLADRIVLHYEGGSRTAWLR